MNESHRWATLFREALAPADSDVLDRLAFVMLLAFSVSVPWLTAAALPSVVSGNAATPVGGPLVIALAFVLGAVTFSSRSSFRSLRPFALPVSAILVMILLGAVQWLPLPGPVLEKIAPVSLQIYHETAEILRTYGNAAPPATRISIAPSQTLLAVLCMAGYAAVFISASFLLRHRPRRRLFAGTILASSVIQVLLFALRRPTGQPLSGGFASTADFAACLLILLPLAFAVVWAEILTSGDRGHGVADTAERLERRISPLVFRVLAWMILAAGVALTEAAGSIAAASVGMLVLLIVALRPYRGARATAAVAALTLASSLLIAARAGASPLSASAPASAAGRTLGIWRVCLDAWKEFPVFGAGFGAFPDAFRRVQPREMTGLVEHAHSNALQLLVTGGVIGELVGIAAAVTLGVVLLQRWKAQRHREESAFILAGFGALISLALDGLVSFNLGAPATWITLAGVLGLASAASNARQTRT